MILLPLVEFFDSVSIMLFKDNRAWEVVILIGLPYNEIQHGNIRHDPRSETVDLCLIPSESLPRLAYFALPVWG